MMVPVAPLSASLARFREGNQRSAAGFIVLHKVKAGLHLRKHAAGREVAFRNILLGLLHVHLSKLLLVGLVEVDAHTVHRSKNHQHVGIDVKGQLRR